MWICMSFIEKKNPQKKKINPNATLNTFQLLVCFVVDCWCDPHIVFFFGGLRGVCGFFFLVVVNSGKRLAEKFCWAWVNCLSEKNVVLFALSRTFSLLQIWMFFYFYFFVFFIEAKIWIVDFLFRTNSFTHTHTHSFGARNQEHSLTQYKRRWILSSKPCKPHSKSLRLLWSTFYKTGLYWHSLSRTVGVVQNHRKRQTTFIIWFSPRSNEVSFVFFIDEKAWLRYFSLIHLLSLSSLLVIYLILLLLILTFYFILFYFICLLSLNFIHRS